MALLEPIRSGIRLDLELPVGPRRLGILALYVAYIVLADRYEGTLLVCVKLLDIDSDVSLEGRILLRVSYLFV